MEVVADAPPLKWGTIHHDGENVVIHFAQAGPPLHILVIAREVIEDVFATRGADFIRTADDNRRRIEAAVAKAWSHDRLREMVEITGTGLRNVQLRLTMEDFR